MKFFIYLFMWLLLAVSVPLALSQRSSYDPAANNRNDSRSGFADFVLEQVNPQNIDYGCEIDGARKLIVAETVKNIVFWTIVVALGLLVLSFFMLLTQHHTRSRLEVVAAGFLAQYHNSLIDARERAETALRRCNALVNATQQVVENVGVGHSPDPEATISDSDLIHTVHPKSPNTNADKHRVTRDAGPSEPLTTKPITGLDHAAEADLIARIKSLQQQLAASHARERNLKRELDKVQRQGQAQPAAKT